MLDHLDLALDFHTNPDIAIAQNLARQLVDDDCSPVEICDTLAAAFPDLDIQAVALHEVLLAQTEAQSRKAHRLRHLATWRTR